MAMEMDQAVVEDVDTVDADEEDAAADSTDEVPAAGMEGVTALEDVEADDQDNANKNSVNVTGTSHSRSATFAENTGTSATTAPRMTSPRNRCRVDTAKDVSPLSNSTTKNDRRP